MFFQPQLCTNCTPFKGVTDLVLVGRNGFASIVSVAGNDELYSCLLTITSALTVIEVSRSGLPTVRCKKSTLTLPKKLGELISSMYLSGTLKALSENAKVGGFKTYGLFIARCDFTIGVQLEVSKAELVIRIPWTNFNPNRLQDEILFFVQKTK